MGKGSTRRPAQVTEAELADNWARVFYPRPCDCQACLHGVDPSVDEGYSNEGCRRAPASASAALRGVQPGDPPQKIVALAEKFVRDYDEGHPREWRVQAEAFREALRGVQPGEAQAGRTLAGPRTRSSKRRPTDIPTSLPCS